VLSSLIALSALGQTINVMTLGGLAPAVGNIGRRLFGNVTPARVVLISLNIRDSE